MGHILAPRSQVSVAPLVRLLLAMAMDIWDRECAPFQPHFCCFCNIRTAISPWGKGPSWNKMIFFVECDQGSIDLGFGVSSSCPIGVMQLTVRATLPNFAFLAVFCPVA